MPPSFPLAVALCVAPATQLPTALWEAAPAQVGKSWWLQPPARKDRAVILLPGLKLHPFRSVISTKPERHDWQQPGSDLVAALSRHSDVFAFGYAQTVPLDEVARSAGLRNAVEKLNDAGYPEIVLIGHSAGGVIARLFVEQYPDCGVTKVILVAAPNNGAGAAAATAFKVGYSKVQAPFVRSLAPKPRLEAMRFGERSVAPHMDVACVVCKIPRLDGDGLVSLASQWPDDLRGQGVPAALVNVVHVQAMRSDKGIRVIDDLAANKLTRWSPEQAEAARKSLYADLLIDRRK